MNEEALLELSRLEREVWRRVRERDAKLQLGEIWKGLDDHDTLFDLQAMDEHALQRKQRA